MSSEDIMSLNTEERRCPYSLPISGHSTRSSTPCLAPEPDTPEPAHWTFFHKPIIVLVMGGLTFSVGVILFLVHSHAAAPACLSIGLMLVAVGLVWIPILKEKLRQRGSGVATEGDAWEPANN